MTVSHSREPHFLHTKCDIEAVFIPELIAKKPVGRRSRVRYPRELSLVSSRKENERDRPNYSAYFTICVLVGGGGWLYEYPSIRWSIRWGRSGNATQGISSVAGAAASASQSGIAVMSGAGGSIAGSEPALPSRAFLRGVFKRRR